MLPLRLVVDTNVVVSAALKPDGLQRTALLIATTKPARLYVSRAILEEYSEVLARPELRIRKGLRHQMLQVIRNNSYSVIPSRHSRLRQTQMTTCFWSVPMPRAPTIWLPAIRSISQGFGRRPRS